MSAITTFDPSDSRENQIAERLRKLLGQSKTPLARFLLASLGGLVPLAGSAIGAGASVWGEKEQAEVNRQFMAWMALHGEQIREVATTLAEVISKLNHEDKATTDRASSAEYESIVRKVVRDWAATESEPKRQLIRNLLTNAASPNQLTPDDVIKLFVEWIAKYSEAHFNVVKIIYHQSEGITRAEIWQKIHGGRVREDSAEADLFKLIIHDLSVGHVIRQERETDGAGNFKRQRASRPRPNSLVLKSAFDDEKDYVLTELGKQFVHYTMTEETRKLN